MKSKIILMEELELHLLGGMYLQVNDSIVTIVVPKYCEKTEL